LCCSFDDKNKGDGGDCQLSCLMDILLNILFVCYFLDLYYLWEYIMCDVGDICYLFVLCLVFVRFICVIVCKTMLFDMCDLI
jgi:hypothetical protein